MDLGGKKMDNKTIFSVQDLLMMQQEDHSFMLEESSLCSLCTQTCTGGTQIGKDVE